jgi:hypothetical protein
MVESILIKLYNIKIMFIAILVILLLGFCIYGAMKAENHTSRSVYIVAIILIVVGMIGTEMKRACKTRGESFSMNMDCDSCKKLCSDFTDSRSRDECMRMCGCDSSDDERPRPRPVQRQAQPAQPVQPVHVASPAPSQQTGTAAACNACMDACGTSSDPWTCDGNCMTSPVCKGVTF